MMGAITSPATGSAHHQPSKAFRTKPPNRIADRYAQKSACLESALMPAIAVEAKQTSRRTRVKYFVMERRSLECKDAGAALYPDLDETQASYQELADRRSKDWTTAH